MKPVDQYRARLMKRLGELDARLHKIESDLDAQVPKDWEDAAVEREGDEVLEGLGQTGQEEIARIQAALQRIRDGEYGYCVKCGAEISEARLEVLPETPLCMSCASGT